MAAPKIVHDLVERFRRNREDYRAEGYRESHLRQEFIDPLFKALGWDMENEQGFAEPGHARTVIERQIEATDRQIDQLVYELYGLTDDEIRLVEEATV
jgi:hypothetical protein